MISSPLGGKRLVLAYSFKKMAFTMLLFSIYFVPIRAEFVKEFYIIFLSIFGFSGFFLFKRYNNVDLFIISAPYLICSILTLLSVIFLSQSFSEFRYIIFIVPSVLVGFFVYGVFYNGGLNEFWA